MKQLEKIRKSLNDLHEGLIDIAEFHRQVEATEKKDPLKSHKEMAKRLEESGAKPGTGKDRACV